MRSDVKEDHASKKLENIIAFLNYRSVIEV